MIKRRRSASIAAAVVLACLAIPASPATAGGGCVIRDAKVIARSASGIVVAKTKVVDGVRVRRIYACLHSTRAVVSLGSRRQSGSVATGPAGRPVISGRYVAYVQSQGEETSTGAVGVNVVDLKQRRRVAGYRYTTGWDVEALVLKPSGGVAWVGNEPPIGEGHSHVLKIDGPHVGTTPNESRVLLDDQPLVDPRSLRLSADRTQLLWARYSSSTGERTDMSAPLG